MKGQGITGVILAGGKSTRMGSDKALVVWKGKRLLDYVLTALDPVCDELLISTHLDLDTTGNYKLIRDRYTDSGPIAGLESGLFHARFDKVLFTSVDSPCLTSGLFSYMLEKHGNFDISLASHQGIHEPMIGVYEKRIYPFLAEYILQGNNKPPAFIQSRKWQEIDIHPDLSFYRPDLFRNLNSPADLIP